MIFAFEDLKNYKNLYRKKEITQSGEDRLLTSSYFNEIMMMSVYYSAVYRRKEDNKFVKYDGKKYPVKFVDYKDLKENEKYFIPIGVGESPYQWMNDHFEDENKFKNLFKLISENKKYFKDLQSGNAYLMIDNSTEGWHDNSIFDYLYNGSSQNFISPNQIIYITGNLNIENNLKEWCKDNPGKKPIQVIPYAHFEFDIGYRVYEMTKDESFELPTIKNHLDMKKIMGDGIRLYNFLNKKPRDHRMWMFNALRKWNLIDNGIVASNEYEWDALEIDFNKTPKEEIDECNKLLPLFPYEDLNKKEFKHYMYNFNTDACIKSWLTVVSETHFEDAQKTLFLSEKTFKAIACQTPFLILGNRNSLDELRKLGYVTFDGFIDEKYDTLPTIHRINAIVDEIRNFQHNKDKIQHLEWMTPMLRHNLNTLKNNALFKAPNKFKKLYKLVNEL
jgi:hypothetical protein